MNKLVIIGNLTKDPESKTLVSGDEVCNFTVAVNRRKKKDGNGQNEADFFRIAAWNGLAHSCQNYLKKGRKVAVVGAVSARAYTNNNGEATASLEVLANEVEFLNSAKDSEGGDGGGTASAPAHTETQPGGYTPVDNDDLPF